MIFARRWFRWRRGRDNKYSFRTKRPGRRAKDEGRIGVCVFPLMALAQDTAAPQGTPPKAQVIEPAESISSLLQARRVYVEPLTGGSSAEAIRQLLIGSLQQSRLFVLTDNPDRADAIVRGAADDKEFTDQFDYQEGLNAHMNAGSFAGSSSSTGRGAGGYGGLSVGENESHHIKERKHEAFAAVGYATGTATCSGPRHRKAAEQTFEAQAPTWPTRLPGR